MGDRGNRMVRDKGRGRGRERSKGEEEAEGGREREEGRWVGRVSQSNSGNPSASQPCLLFQVPLWTP